MFIDTLFATHCDLISTSLINSLLTDISNNTNYKGLQRGGVAQRVAHLTRNVEVVDSSPIKGPRCFIEQETYPHCPVCVAS